MSMNGKDTDYDALSVIIFVIAGLVLLTVVIITGCKVEKCP